MKKKSVRFVIIIITKTSKTSLQHIKNYKWINHIHTTLENRGILMIQVVLWSLRIGIVKIGKKNSSSSSTRNFNQQNKARSEIKKYTRLDEGVNGMVIKITFHTIHAVEPSVWSTTRQSTYSCNDVVIIVFSNEWLFSTTDSTRASLAVIIGEENEIQDFVKERGWRDCYTYFGMCWVKTLAEKLYFKSG